MRAYREQDFDKMAERVVARFMDGGKLAEAAANEAMEGQLNPDQIARLVHAANTMAFLQLMDQQRTQGHADMTTEFDPIDPRQIIEHMVHSVDVPHSEPDGDEPPVASPDAAPLPDETRRAPGPPNESGPPIDDNDGPFPKGEKQKARDDAAKKDKPENKGSAKDTKKEAAFRERRLRKFAEVLDDQYRQAEWAFEDGLSRLRQCLARASRATSANHLKQASEAFEKDALALHGDDVGIAVLNIVRSDWGMEPLEFDDARAKCAALADRHVVTPSEESRIFEQLVKIATEAQRLQRGAAHVRSLCT